MSWPPEENRQDPLPTPDPPASPGFGPGSSLGDEASGRLENSDDPQVTYSSQEPSAPKKYDPEGYLADQVTTSPSHSTSPTYYSGSTGEATAISSREEEDSPTIMPLSRLAMMLFILGATLALCYFSPWFVEQIVYSYNHGKLRAEYSHAGEALEQVSLQELSTASQLISQRVGPSVVHINTVRSGRQPLAGHHETGDIPEFFARQTPEERGQGSGVILDEAGYLLTNYHVVEGASTIEVHLSDGRTFLAQSVGHDEKTDLAVLKIDADGLFPAEWGDSDELDPGSMVWALGSPFGLERSVSFGIVSAVHRGQFTGQPYQDVLQTDAAVNPGNSGGPLVDVNGHVIGINTAIVGNAYQGVSFAIPSSIAREMYEELLTNGSVKRGWLGVQLDTVSEERAEALGLDRPQGAFVVAVIGDRRDPSPAYNAGIVAGDVILKWNEAPIDVSGELSRQVARSRPGETAIVTIWRDGQELELEVNVTERSSEF